MTFRIDFADPVGPFALTDDRAWSLYSRGDISVPNLAAAVCGGYVARVVNEGDGLEPDRVVFIASEPDRLVPRDPGPQVSELWEVLPGSRYHTAQQLTGRWVRIIREMDDEGDVWVEPEGLLGVGDINARTFVEAEFLRRVQA